LNTKYMRWGSPEFLFQIGAYLSQLKSMGSTGING